MAKEIDRSDRQPWEKIHATPGILALVGKGDTLSSSLRMTKYSPVGGCVKKQAVDWMCKGVQRAASVTLPNAASFRMRLKSRMMVNHSGGVMENATLALHPHFGTPFIPGSALKGIAGHAAWCEWMDADTEGQELYGSILADLFGYPFGNEKVDEALKKSCETRSGAIAFLPAHCICTAMLDTDLINSHNGPNPIPVFLPAVAAKTEFEFRLQPLRVQTDNEIDTLLYFAETWLKQGLREHGAGAKTNAGYGWFEEMN
jgi:CRISPR-associated protein Cmr6